MYRSVTKPLSAKGLERQLGITSKTAWRVAKLIREYMADVDGESSIGGPGTNGEIDETHRGGVRRGVRNRPKTTLSNLLSTFRPLNG